MQLPTANFMCGLERASVRYKQHLAFLDYVMSPLWSPVVEMFPPLKPCLQHLLDNRKFFATKCEQAEIQELQQQTNSTNQNQQQQTTISNTIEEEQSTDDIDDASDSTPLSISTLTARRASFFSSVLHVPHSASSNSPSPSSYPSSSPSPASSSVPVSPQLSPSTSFTSLNINVTNQYKHNEHGQHAQLQQQNRKRESIKERRMKQQQQQQMQQQNIHQQGNNEQDQIIISASPVNQGVLSNNTSDNTVFTLSSNHNSEEV